ncbi:MAG: hypothetical protein CSB33_05490 [Desulfobacterales bacterium]|nr:MAG: hypothetical protein CSB33_05490 [Desulfobacterales bacterium]
MVGRINGKTVVPYFDRSQIDGDNALDGRAPVLAWVDDPVALFFLHVQGSGKIALDNGDLINVHYHLTNGHPYRSIGRVLIEEGIIPREKMSMQAIRSYLDAHPEIPKKCVPFSTTIPVMCFSNSKMTARWAF